MGPCQIVHHVHCYWATQLHRWKLYNTVWAYFKLHQALWMRMIYMRVLASVPCISRNFKTQRLLSEWCLHLKCLSFPHLWQPCLGSNMMARLPVLFWHLRAWERRTLFTGYHFEKRGHLCYDMCMILSNFTQIHAPHWESQRFWDRNFVMNAFSGLNRLCTFTEGSKTFCTKRLQQKIFLFIWVKPNHLHPNSCSHIRPI